MERLQTVASIKRGDTFALPCAYEPAVGSPSLTGVVVTCDVKTREGGLVAHLNVRVLDEAQGAFAIDSGDTRAWPVGVLLTDIRYTQGSSSSSTDTFQITVAEAITERA